jgi:hypothetical protein
MLSRIKLAFRVLLLLFLVFWLWAIWAGAQTATNASATSRTKPQPTALVQQVEKLKTSNFDLDRFAPTAGYHLDRWSRFGSISPRSYTFFWRSMRQNLSILSLASGSRKFTSRTVSGVDDVLTGELLHGPIKVVVFVLLLNIGLNIFDWSSRARTLLSKGLILVVARFSSYLAVKVSTCCSACGDGAMRTKRMVNLSSALFGHPNQSQCVHYRKRDSRYAQNMNVDITAAIASLSTVDWPWVWPLRILWRIYSARWQCLSTNLSALEIKSSWMGPRALSRLSGLRSTRVRNAEGHLIAVPNKTMGSAIVTNITRRPNIKTVMNFPLARTPPNR